MGKTNNISPDARMINLLELNIAYQKKIMTEINRLHERMDKLEGKAMLSGDDLLEAEKLFSYAQTSELLDTPVRTLYELRKRNEIECTKIGRTVKFSREQIQAFKRKHALKN